MKIGQPIEAKETYASKSFVKKKTCYPQFDPYVVNENINFWETVKP